MALWIQDIQRDLGITVLMVEHDMSLVSKVSDRVLAMNQGEVLALGTPAEVQAHPGVIEAYLGSTDDLSSLRRTSGMTHGDARATTTSSWRWPTSRAPTGRSRPSAASA